MSLTKMFYSVEFTVNWSIPEPKGLNVTIPHSGSDKKFTWGIDDFDLGCDLNVQLLDKIKKYDPSTITNLRLIAFNNVTQSTD